MTDYGIDCGSNLTIDRAEEFLGQLRCVPVEVSNVTLGTEALERVDAAGLQILIAFFKEARRRGMTVSCEQPSKVLIEAARLLGLSEELGLSRY